MINPNVYPGLCPNVDFDIKPRIKQTKKLLKEFIKRKISLSDKNIKNIFNRSQKRITADHRLALCIAGSEIICQDKHSNRTIRKYNDEFLGKIVNRTRTTVLQRIPLGYTLMKHDDNFLNLVNIYKEFFSLITIRNKRTDIITIAKYNLVKIK